MRIAFVFAPYHHKAFEENIDVVDEEFGVFPPINLAYAAAIAEDAGHQVVLVDANAEGLSASEVVDRLRPFAPPVIGGYLTTYMIPDTLALVRELRQHFDAKVVVGGINLLLYPHETLAHEVVDYALAGQTIDTLPVLLEAIEAGEPPPDDLPGLCQRRDGEVVCNPPPGPIAFDRLPLPARHLLPNDRYYSFISQKKPFTMMVTTLGCRCDCRFCAIAPLPYDERSAESVLGEMEECVRRYGVKEIDIFDADFPANRERTVEICLGILDRGLEFEWSCRSRIEVVDEDLLRLMARAGLRQIYYGIETPDPRALARMSKPLRPENVRKTIDATHRAGIRPLGFFMTGVPGETRRSLLRTARYANRLGLDYAQFSRTIAKPGSALYREQVERTGEDYWREWVLGRESERRMGSHWTRMSEREIEVLTKFAYYGFYFRPGLVARSLLRMTSADEVRRSASVAAQMLLSLARFDR